MNNLFPNISSQHSQSQPHKNKPITKKLKFSNGLKKHLKPKYFIIIIHVDFTDINIETTIKTLNKKGD